MRQHVEILRHAAPQQRRFVWIALLTLASSGLAALQPWPMKLVVDHVLGNTPAPAWLTNAFATLSVTPTPLALLAIGAIGGLMLFGINSALEVALTSAWTLAGRRMVYDLAKELFARLQRRSLLFHSRSSVGDLMSRITGDSWCVYQLADTLAFAPAHALLTMALMIFLMLQLDPGLTLVAVAAAPLTVGASFIVGKPLHLAARLRREIESRIQSHIQQTLTGMPVVQAFGQEDREQRRFQHFADEVIRVQQRTALLTSINSLGSGLVTTLGAGVVLWFGAQHVLDGRLSLGGILVFLVYLTSLQAQTKTLAGMYAGFRTIGASVDRVAEVLRAPPDIPEQPAAPPLPPVKGRVTFENVGFSYDPERPVLRDISFVAEPGETIAIVGPTGAGKTTLVNLVPRFFDPSQGRVSIDGKDVRQVQLRSLRDQIALVVQEPFLFPIRVAENIALGRPSATRAEIEAAARAANAHEFIEQLPQGYDTVIGERGATLSGGERQRLAIARALLRNAPILILDEPTSALDAETEHSLLEALNRLRAGRTTFIIAHRLSTVRNADRILVLKDGRIAESGTHDELMRNGQFYAHLHRIHESR